MKFIFVCLFFAGVCEASTSYRDVKDNVFRVKVSAHSYSSIATGFPVKSDQHLLVNFHSIIPAKHRSAMIKIYDRYGAFIGLGEIERINISLDIALIYCEAYRFSHIFKLATRLKSRSEEVAYFAFGYGVGKELSRFDLIYGK